jgi:hypothetical protein
MAYESTVRPRGDSRTTPLSWFRWWADLLDSRYRIPGTNVRFGLDPVLSLIPGLGDLASPAFAVALIVQGLHQRVPRLVLLRMVGNALVDAVVGAVPGVGTVADIFWRANSRNLALLERHAQGVHPLSKGDYTFLFGVAIAFGVVTLLVLILAVWITVGIWRWWTDHIRMV